MLDGYALAIVNGGDEAGFTCGSPKASFDAVAGTRRGEGGYE